VEFGALVVPLVGSFARLTHDFHLGNSEAAGLLADLATDMEPQRQSSVTGGGGAGIAAKEATVIGTPHNTRKGIVAFGCTFVRVAKGR